MSRRVLFHRTWPPNNPNVGTSGGQQKVRDAFEHVRSFPGFDPYVHFPPSTQWHDNPGNVWLSYRAQALTEWKVLPGDILFLAGRDWAEMSVHPRAFPDNPVVAIAQPRHVRPEDIRLAHLRERAIRIAKSEAGRQILEAHGVNGPVICIPDAIDFSQLPAPNDGPAHDLFIVGLKNPQLARTLKKRIEEKYGASLRVTIQDAKLPTRQDFLRQLNDCRMACFLPVPPEKGLEGFYLPALEAMVLGKLVICPDAIGNRDFCLKGQTCIMPEYSLESYLSAIHHALKMSRVERQEMLHTALQRAQRHELEGEREAYRKLFSQVDNLWADENLFWPR